MFRDYHKETPSSFSSSPLLLILPQFMFNLRWSYFVQLKLIPSFIEQFWSIDHVESHLVHGLFYFQCRFLTTVKMKLHISQWC